MAKRTGPAILLLLLTALPLWRALLLGEGIGPYDHVRALGPWNGPAPTTPWDVLQMDGVLQFRPWRTLVLEGWGRFDPPFWNPYQFAGTPLLANSQSGALYPPHVLLGLLHVPVVLAMALLAWGHLALAAFGAGRLARELGASATGGWIAGAAFGLSPFLLAWTALPSVVSTVAWIPWVLAGIVAAFRRSGPLWAVGLPVGMTLLAGHLQFAAYGAMAAAVVFVAEAVRARGAGAAKIVLALVAGALLAMPQVFPVLNFSRDSHRRGAPTAEGYEAYRAGTIQPYELLGIAGPTLVGRPTAFAEEGAPFPAYWPQWVKRGGNYAEGAVGLGPAVLLLLFSVRRRAWREALPGALLLALGAGLMLDTPLNRLLYFGVPGWSSTGSPGRAGALFVLAACVLAGVGATRAEEKRSYLPLVAAVLATVLSVVPLSGVVPGLTPWFPGMTAETFRAIVAKGTATELLVTLVALGVAGIFGALAVREPKRSGLLAVPVITGFALFSWGLVRTGPSDLSVPNEYGSERIAVVGADWQLTGPAKTTLPPNLASLNRIHDLAGYDSLVDRGAVELLRRVNRGQDPAPPANGNMMLVKGNPDGEALADAGVTRLRPAEGIGPNDDDYYRPPGPGRASVDGRPATIAAEGLSFVEVRASGPGRLTLRDRNRPGWRAAVDGRPTTLSGAVWREVELPEGEHRVRFEYTPPGWALGWFVGVVGSLVLAGLAWSQRRVVATATQESAVP